MRGPTDGVSRVAGGGVIDPSCVSAGRGDSLHRGGVERVCGRELPIGQADVREDRVRHVPGVEKLVFLASAGALRVR
jgi:hypothetical protein